MVCFTPFGRTVMASLIAESGILMLAQSPGVADDSGWVKALIGAAGGTLFAIWYGYYQTTVVQPRVEARHAEERKRDTEMFTKLVQEQAAAYQQLIRDSEARHELHMVQREARHDKAWEAQEERHREERKENKAEIAKQAELRHAQGNKYQDTLLKVHETLDRVAIRLEIGDRVVRKASKVIEKAASDSGILQTGPEEIEE